MRGWNPLNYILLDNPEIESRDIPALSSHPPEIITVNSDEGTTTSSLTTNEIDINFRDGLADNCVLSLLQQAAKDKECMANLQKRKESNKTFFEHMKESKRLTAGVIFNARVVNLVKGGLLQVVKDNQKTKHKEVIEKIEKEIERFKKRCIKADNCLKKFQRKHSFLNDPNEIPEEELGMEDLKTFVMSLKRKSDKAMPKGIQELHQRWKEVKVLSRMNVFEHLLDQGYPRDLVDITIQATQEPQQQSPSNNEAQQQSPLHLLPATAAF